MVGSKWMRCTETRRESCFECGPSSPRLTGIDLLGDRSPAAFVSPLVRLLARKGRHDVNRESGEADTRMQTQRRLALPSRRKARWAAGAVVVLLAAGLTALVVSRTAP